MVSSNFKFSGLFPSFLILSVRHPSQATLARRLGGFGGSARDFTSRLAAFLICLTLVVDSQACLWFRFLLLLGERPFILFYFNIVLCGDCSLCIRPSSRLSRLEVVE
jgi:hypothetical protein